MTFERVTFRGEPLLLMRRQPSWPPWMMPGVLAVMAPDGFFESGELADGFAVGADGRVWHRKVLRGTADQIVFTGELVERHMSVAGRAHVHAQLAARRQRHDEAVARAMAAPSN